MGPAIPDEQHIARYCAQSTFIGGKPSYLAFLLKPATDKEPREPYLSAFWLEALTGTTTEERLADLRREVADKSILKAKKSAVYSVQNVGNTRRVVRERSRDDRLLRIVEEPPPAFHVGIHDTAEDEDTVAKALVESVLSYAPAVTP
jgi:hypothetical protein